MLRGEMTTQRSDWRTRVEGGAAVDVLWQRGTSLKNRRILVFFGLGMWMMGKYPKDFQMELKAEGHPQYGFGMPD